MEEDLHFIEQRVGVIAFCGGLAGASRAILKGHPMLRTSLLTGMSCAMGKCLILSLHTFNRSSDL